MSLRIVKAQKTSLRTPLAADGTTVKVRALLDSKGNTIAFSAFGEFGVVVVKQGDTIEMIKFDGVTQNADGSADLDVATNGRDILPIYPYTGSATGEDFQTGEVIITNDPLTMSRFASLDNANTWDEVQTFTVPPVLPTPVANTDGANKAYVDGVGSAGASDANETTKGLVEAATQTEVDEGDDTGSTTAPTAVRPSKAANAVQRGVWVAFTESASGDDAYTADTTPSFTPALGSMVYGSFAVGNTGGATFALNGETPVAIQKVVSGALGAIETGDIIANAPLFLYRTASVWVLLSPGGTMPSTALLSEMAAVFAATDITGAELETNSAGPTSDATQLHKHNTVKAYDTNNTPGDQNETTLATYTIPAGRLGTKSGVRVRFWVTGTGNNASKLIKIKLGGTTIFTETIPAGTVAVGAVGEAWFFNSGSAAAQDWFLNSMVINDVNGTSSESIQQATVTHSTTTTQDTSGALAFAITIQSQHGSDSVTGTAYIEILDRE